MAVYAQPGQSGAVMEYKARYDHWIGGKYVPPSSGQYFENVTPVTGRVFCEIARGNAEDIDKALSLTEEIYRVPFLMYFKGFKYHEIAEELDLPIGTVKNRIHIARKTLKSSLKMYA